MTESTRAMLHTSHLTGTVDDDLGARESGYNRTRIGKPQARASTITGQVHCPRPEVYVTAPAFSMARDVERWRSLAGCRSPGA